MEPNASPSGGSCALWLAGLGPICRARVMVRGTAHRRVEVRPRHSGRPLPPRDGQRRWAGIVAAERGRPTRNRRKGQCGDRRPGVNQVHAGAVWGPEAAMHGGIFPPTRFRTLHPHIETPMEGLSRPAAQAINDWRQPGGRAATSESRASPLIVFTSDHGFDDERQRFSIAGPGGVKK